MSDFNWEHAEVSPELLEWHRGHIGKEYVANGWITEATVDAIRHFAEGIGDDNPLHLDPAYAAKSRFGGIIAPPTFLDVFSNRGFESDDGFSRGPIEGLFGLWAADIWEFQRPVRVGDKVKPTFSLAGLRERPSKFGGVAYEQTEQTKFHDQRGQQLATYRVLRFNFERSKAREQAKYADLEPYRYSDEEIEAIQRAYEQEPANRRGDRPRYAEDVSAGDELPALVKGPVTLTQLIGFVLGWGSAYCAANRMGHQFAKKRPKAVLINRELNVPDNVEGAHWDLNLAKESGYPWTYDFGGMRTAWTAHLLSDWIGDDGWLKRLEVQIRRPNIIGDTQWMHGKVKAVRNEGGEALVDVDVWAQSQRNETTAVGQATVSLPTKG